MKEYTLLSLISVALTFFIARLLKPDVFKRKIFWIFIAIILIFKFMVNGYLTGAAVVQYSNDFFLGFRIGSIPIEDFLFGFSMVSLSIIFWEYFKKGGK